MSRNLGKSIPESILGKLGRGSRERENSVIFLLTVDANGHPHVALLSPYQVLIMKNGEILFAVHSSSGTASYLSSQGKCTFIFQSPPSIAYVKTEVREMKGKIIGRGPFRNLVFTGYVSEVLEDYSEKAPFISDLRFRPDDVSSLYEEEFRGLSGIADEIE